MGDIAQNVAALAVVIAIGWGLARTGVLGPSATQVLSDFVYWAGTPALLFSTISTTPVANVAGASLAAAAASGFGSALVFAVIARLLMHARGGHLVLGSMSASLNNASYIGLPIAVYVLGDASYSVPILMFQLGFFTPMFFVLADLAGGRTKPTLGGVLKTVFTNPMVIAALLGFAASAANLHLPPLITTTASLVGETAPGVVLIAFGTSLVGQRFSIRSSEGHLTALASASKLFVQPGIAMLVGYLMGLRGHELMAVVVMAGLPTAQNAFIAARRAGVGEQIAEGTVMVTTAAALPLTILTSWLFVHFLGA